jgi:acetamidase/formamidase
LREYRPGNGRRGGSRYGEDALLPGGSDPIRLGQRARTRAHVEPGDTVVYHTREVSDGQITPDSTTEDLAGLNWERLYPLAGPVAMAGAEPGDILAVEVLDIHTQGWGWSAVLPGFGFLPEDFPDAYLQVFDLANGDYTHFKDDIAIPIDPFFGTMGVSPTGPEKPVIMPPGPFGGNMDTRHITKGSALYLPVQHAGAPFSCEDAHAAQGDGEVCVTDIECAMYASLRFDLIKGRSIPAPQFQTPSPLTPMVEDMGWYATMWASTPTSCRPPRTRSGPWSSTSAPPTGWSP